MCVCVCVRDSDADDTITVHRPQIPTTYSEELRALSTQLLERETEARPSAADILINPFVAAHIQGTCAWHLKNQTYINPRFSVKERVSVWFFLVGGGFLPSSSPLPGFYILHGNKRAFSTDGTPFFARVKKRIQRRGLIFSAWPRAIPNTKTSTKEKEKRTKLTSLHCRLCSDCHRK